MSDAAVAFLQAVKAHSTAGDAESEADFALVRLWHAVTPVAVCPAQEVWVHLHEAAMRVVGRSDESGRARECFMLLAARAFDLARDGESR